MRAYDAEVERGVRAYDAEVERGVRAYDAEVEWGMSEEHFGKLRRVPNAIVRTIWPAQLVRLSDQLCLDLGKL
ncbi:MAG: hypothetical protein ACC649_06610 [Myxococcota bacterium]